MLKDATLGDAMANLRYLCGSPHGPARPEALHRLLRHVRVEGDLEVVTKALVVARRSAMRCTFESAALLTAAAIRAGKPEFALDVFARSRDLRIFPGSSSFEQLLKAVVQRARTPAEGGAAAASTLLKAVLRSMWLARLSPASSSRRLSGLVASAHVACGDLGAALQALRDRTALTIAAAATGAAAESVPAITPSAEEGGGGELLPGAASAVASLATNTAAAPAVAPAKPLSLDRRPFYNLLHAVQSGAFSAELLESHSVELRALIAEIQARWPQTAWVLELCPAALRVIPPPPAEAAGSGAGASAPAATPAGSSASEA